MPVRQNKEKIHHSRFHSDSQYRLLLFFFKFIGSDPKLPTTIEITYLPTPHIFRTWLSQKNDTFKLSNHSFLSLLHKIMIIRPFHISHNATYLSPPPPKKKILHNLCFSFLLGIKAVQREIENNAYAKFSGSKQGALWEMWKWRMTEAHQMEPPSPIQSLGVNPFPSRFIIRTVPRGDFARRRWEEPITTT